MKRVASSNELLPNYDAVAIDGLAVSALTLPGADRLAGVDAAFPVCQDGPQ